MDVGEKISIYPKFIRMGRANMKFFKLKRDFMNYIAAMFFDGSDEAVKELTKITGITLSYHGTDEYEEEWWGCGYTTITRNSYVVFQQTGLPEINRDKRSIKTLGKIKNKLKAVTSIPKEFFEMKHIDSGIEDTEFNRFCTTCRVVHPETNGEYKELVKTKPWFFEEWDKVIEKWNKNT